MTPKDIIEKALRAGLTALDEEAGKELFRAYGIAVPEGATAMSVEEAVEAAQRIGYPVVMKGLSAEVQHKTEAGLVILNLSDDQEVVGAFETLHSQAWLKGIRLDGVLVEQMIRSPREFVAGLVRDRLFGPVVMFGLGGIFTEALNDVAFALAPLGRESALELLDQISSRSLLGEVRGMAPVDREKLADILVALGTIAQDHPQIREIDINPLLIDGSSPMAVDALVAVGEPVQTSSRPPAGASRLGFLLAPRSVAVIGASSDTGKWGGMLVANLRLGGFGGSIYPVNPKGGTVLGLPVYKSVADLPEAPELAIIALAAPLVNEALEECGRNGVKAVVVVAAGFSEAGEEGRALEEQIVATAEKYGMILVGPNCMGLISAHQGLYGTGFTLLRPQPGGASMVSQSGNLGVQLIISAERRKGGIGKFIGVGNEAMIDAVDFIDYLRTDAETTMIAAYMEGFDDGRRLYEVVSETSLQKPVVVLHGGTSEFGQHAAASHTGAMASSNAIFEAAARQSGMIVSTDPDEFMDLTFALSYMPLPPGKRVAVATLGGGWGVLVADEVARSGLQMARISPQVMESLNRLLPPYWSHANPVDMVASVAPDVPESVLEVLVASDEVDAVIVLGVVGSMSESRRATHEIERLKAACSGGNDQFDPNCLPPDEEVEPPEPELSEREMRFIRQVERLMDEHCKPIANISFKPMTQAVFHEGGRFSTFVLPSPLRGVRMLGKMAAYSEYLQKRGLDLRCAKVEK